jgi:hypothetical protein
VGIDAVDDWDAVFSGCNYKPLEGLDDVYGSLYF